MMDEGQNLIFGLVLVFIVFLAGGFIISDFQKRSEANIISICGQEYYDCNSKVDVCGNMDIQADFKACDKLAMPTCPYLNGTHEAVCSPLTELGK